MGNECSASYGIAKKRKTCLAVCRTGFLLPYIPNLMSDTNMQAIPDAGKTK